ncbi:MAG: response regulator [Nitrosomonas sp.]|nr:response regulator [Nitrosomonas sp.]MCW5608010.1 response regulator [Nitrosomonas sp.]
MNLWSLKNKSVLIVDDYDKMRLLIREMLMPLGPAKVAMARNGKEAIELLEGNAFDIVLCDYKLGNGRDGQQVLEEARHRNLLSHAAIFFIVTTENASKMVMGAIDHLPDDYISKPFTQSQIQTRLEKASRRKAKLEEIAEAVNAKNFSKALNICDQKLREETYGLIEVQKIKGDLLCKLGRLDEAERYYIDLLKDRDIPWVRLALGKVYFQKQNYAEAEVQFELLINENPAYIHALDWLADTLEVQGQLERSQHMLERAIDLSPKSPVRQRKLGAIAFRNGAYDIAEEAYGNAILTGRNSCFGNLADAAGLTRSLINQDKIKEAFESIENIKQDFKNNPDAQLYIALSKSILYRETNDLDECGKNLDIVFKNLNKRAGALHPETALEIAQTCLTLDNHELTNKIIKQLVNDHSENEKLLDQVRQLYEKAGKLDEANDIIQSTRQEIVKINNEGVKMVQDGKLEQSINFFIQAAKGMPNNATINFNAAYSMIRQMKRTREMGKYFSLCQKLMEQGHKVDPNNQKYFQLLKLTEELSNETT